jgi:hypothetical protein
MVAGLVERDFAFQVGDDEYAVVVAWVRFHEGGVRAGAQGRFPVDDMHLRHRNQGGQAQRAAGLDLYEGLRHRFRVGPVAGLRIGFRAALVELEDVAFLVGRQH